MSTTTPSTASTDVLDPRSRPVRFRATDCHLEDFAAVVGQTTVLADYPYASEVAQGVLVYDASRLREAAAHEAGRERVEGELVRALTTGPGVVVFQGAFADLDVVDRATAAFDAVITYERAAVWNEEARFELARIYAVRE